MVMTFGETILLLCGIFEADGHITDLLEDAVIRGTFRKYMGEHTDDN